MRMNRIRIVASLVHKGFRDMTPAMYFLAMFNKRDIEAINGWDEAFMQGYAYEDDDFGQRWVRAGLPFQLREDIQGVHQYHQER
jgi:predicted glycosyltransferase involved in capsule biosynthesis